MAQLHQRNDEEEEIKATADVEQMLARAGACTAPESKACKARLASANARTPSWHALLMPALHINMHIAYELK